MNLLFLLVGFAPLVFGAELLVDNASRLAARLKVPAIVIGMTIVAFGTSAPELVVNLTAASTGSGAIALGNIVGSNIFNIFVILGIAALVRPLAVQSNTTWIEIPLTLLSALVVLGMAADRFLDGSVANLISRSDGVILLGFFAIFLGYSASLLAADRKRAELQPAASETLAENHQKKERHPALLLGLIVLGLGGLVLGGRLIVENAVSLARSLGVAERIIGLTIVSAGTSLPELAASVAAARRGQVDIAVGNVVGSNLFNLFFILGLTAVVSPLAIESGSFLDMAVNILGSLLLFVFVFTGRGRKIERPEAVLFLLLFVGYTTYLILS